MTYDNATMGENAEQITELIRCIAELKEEVRTLRQEQSLTDKPCYTNEEVLKLFGVTPPTLRKWRNEGLLGYTQIGSTLIYSKKDITDFMESNHYEAYAA